LELDKKRYLSISSKNKQNDMRSVTIKKSESTEESLKKIQYQLKNAKKSFNASKYCGILEKRVDPVDYQKKIRSEWDESSG
jgi:uncharacterized membrane-anchored protein